MLAKLLLCTGNHAWPGVKTEADVLGRLIAKQTPEGLTFVPKEMQVLARECVNYDPCQQPKMPQFLTMFHSTGKK